MSTKTNLEVAGVDFGDAAYEVSQAELRGKLEYSIVITEDSADRKAFSVAASWDQIFTKGGDGSWDSAGVIADGVKKVAEVKGAESAEQAIRVTGVRNIGAALGSRVWRMFEPREESAAKARTTAMADDARASVLATFAAIGIDPTEEQIAAAVERATAAVVTQRNERSAKTGKAGRDAAKAPGAYTGVPQNGHGRNG